MTRRPNALTDDFSVCRWVNLHEALHHFGTYAGKTQSQEHIKPLHWYVASRLVVEGGFHPDEIAPRPPFSVQKRAGRYLLSFDASLAKGGEGTVLGGLKTKNVDVVVTKAGIGPVLVVSCKGMTGAFRNLTNRMEDTIGECTNLHITYPALVLGYLFVIRANRHIEEIAEDLPPLDSEPTKILSANDIAIQEGGEPVESIIRFHSALRELTGRRGIRNDVSRYESVALAMMEASGNLAGELLPNFPSKDSPLRLEKFFQTLYLRYEERYLIGAPDLKSITKRLEWADDSPAFATLIKSEGPLPELDYEIRRADQLETILGFEKYLFVYLIRFLASTVTVMTAHTPTKEELELYVTIWSEDFDTQMHFNEMSVKSRQLGFTFVAAALGVSVVLLAALLAARS